MSPGDLIGFTFTALIRHRRQNRRKMHDSVDAMYRSRHISRRRQIARHRRNAVGKTRKIGCDEIKSSHGMNVFSKSGADQSAHTPGSTSYENNCH